MGSDSFVAHHPMLCGATALFGSIVASMAVFIVALSLFVYGVHPVVPSVAPLWEVIPYGTVGLFCFALVFLGLEYLRYDDGRYLFGGWLVVDGILAFIVVLSLTRGIGA